MIKKDVYILVFFPACSLLLLASFALFFSGLASRENDVREYHRLAVDKTYEHIFDEAKRGKTSVSTDDWIKIIRQDRKTAQAEYETAFYSANVLHSVGEIGIIFAAMNVLVVLYIRDNIKRREQISAAENKK
jgi:hypothetical protein